MCGKLRAIKIYWNWAADDWPSLHIKLFLKIKRDLELVFPASLLHNFWRKIFLLLYSIDWPNFIVWLRLLCEILGNTCIAIVCKPGCEVMNFDVKLVFLIKLFFLHDQKVVTKRYFSSFLKGFESSKSQKIFWKVRVQL